MPDVGASLLFKYPTPSPVNSTIVYTKTTQERTVLLDPLTWWLDWSKMAGRIKEDVEYHNSSAIRKKKGSLHTYYL